MARRLAEAPDADLERALRELGRSLPIPAERDLAEPVGARLRAEGPSRPAIVRLPVALRPARTLRRAAVLAAALLMLAAGVAVAGRLGLPGVRIIFSKTPPSIPPTTPGPSLRPTPTDLGHALGLGDPVSLERARTAVSFPVRLPKLPSLGEPSGIYLAWDVPGGRVSFTYEPRSGWPVSDDTGLALLLTELRGSTERELFAKIVGPGTRVDDVRVHGYPGLWIHGAPHEIYFQGPNGGIESDTVRLAGDVLLWQEGGVILRLEGAMDLPQALSVANSLDRA
jgi:hypothetical protein